MGIALITNNILSDSGTAIAGLVPTSRTISTTAPLTGGGDLSADRTIAIPAATSAVNGYLTSADWTTFNSKQNALTNPVTGTGTTNYIPKFTGASAIGDSNIFQTSGFANIAGNLKIESTEPQIYLNKTGTDAGTWRILGSTGETLRRFRIYDEQAGLDRFDIFSNGNVAINTTTDAGYRLDVNGLTRVKTLFLSYSASTLANQNSGIIWTNGTIGNAFGFVVQSGVFFQGDGNGANDVFGVKSPTADGTLGSTVFSVASNGALSGTSAIFSSSVTASGGKAQFIADGGTGAGAEILLKTSLSTNPTLRRNWAIATEDQVEGDFVIKSSNSAGGSPITTRLSILSNGNVGIGVNSSSYRFVVNSATNGISAGIVGSTYGIRFDNGGSFAFGGSAIHGVDNTLTGSYQTLGLNGTEIIFGISGTEQMKLNSNGYLLVGGLRLKGSDTANTIYAGNSNMAITSESGYNIHIGRSSNTTIGLNVKTDTGNVLIGTTTDSGYKLDVNGNTRATSFYAAGSHNTPNALVIAADTNWTFGCFESGSAQYWMQVKYYGVDDDNRGFRVFNVNNNTVDFRVNGLGNGIFRGASYATAFYESSDKTIKTLIKDNYQAKGIESVVAKLYTKNGKEELGYFAQDVQGILPSAVIKGTDGLLSLSYREVHTAKISALEKRVAELEQQLNLN